MFGFEAWNSAGSVLISDFARPLVYAFRGSVVIQNTSVVDRPATGSVTFRYAITTPQPPRLFLRMSSTRHANIDLYLYFTGTAGNWTGAVFKIAANGGKTLPRYTFDYVVATTSHKAPDQDYGMQIFDETGAQVFTSSDRIVVYSKFTKKWRQVYTIPGYHYLTYYSDIAIAPDDFIDLSAFNRGTIFQQMNNPMFFSVELLRNNTRVLNLVTQAAGSPYGEPLGTANLNFCIPICKFPTSRYP